MYPAGLLWAMFAVVAFRSFYMVFEMAQVGGNNVFVAAHAGADGSAVRGGMQGEQGGGKGFGAVVGEFAREGFAHEAVADVLEVVHAGAKGDGDARVQCFERVVAAVGDEAAADVGEVADAVVVGEFAEGVEDEDVAVAAGGFAPTAQTRGVTGVAHQLGNAVAAFGVAWREDEACVRQGLLENAVCGDGAFVFAGVSGWRAAAMSGGSGVSGGVWYLRLGVMLMFAAGTPSLRKRRASLRVCAFICRWASGSRSRWRA